MADFVASYPKVMLSLNQRRTSKTAGVKQLFEIKILLFTSAGTANGNFWNLPRCTVALASV